MTEIELLIRYLRAEEGQDKQNILYWLRKMILEGGKDE